MLDPRVIDPDGVLVPRDGLDDADLDQVVRVMVALSAWRAAEQQASEAARRSMNLGETDMRALRFAVAARHAGRVVTPGALADHLRISTASTTKLVDRLVAAGHVRRVPHPTDRRSVGVEVTEEAARAARETVGRGHARRFEVAARLTPRDREVVARFLEDLARATTG
ncbi:MarR family transcriptional regulator [Xylanimonas oleitrophica]|uniref:MarR family transcriptional regulator n=2 Tax=Xylanimonas oleitrophica TaxID=2607479 RepID=A0A2W5WVW0_9MICO|nr:MarR family transcriptional regulator [Xylanimonas oleitrophica]